MTTPQSFTMASPPAQSTGYGVGHPHFRRPRTASRPLSTRFEPVHRLRDVTTGSSPAPSRLAHQARPVWQYQTALTLSGLLPALPGVPRIRLSPASSGRCDDPTAKVSHLHSDTWRLVAHGHVQEQHWRGPAVSPRLTMASRRICCTQHPSLRSGAGLPWGDLVGRCGRAGHGQPPRGSQRKRRMAMMSPTTPHAARTVRSPQLSPDPVVWGL